MGNTVESIGNLCQERKFEEAKIVLVKIGYEALSHGEIEEIKKIIEKAGENNLSPLQGKALEELGQDISFRRKFVELKNLFERGDFAEMQEQISEINRGGLSSDQEWALIRLEIEELFFDGTL